MFVVIGMPIIVNEVFPSTHLFSTSHFTSELPLDSTAFEPGPPIHMRMVTSHFPTSVPSRLCCGLLSQDFSQRSIAAFMSLGGWFGCCGFEARGITASAASNRDFIFDLLSNRGGLRGSRSRAGLRRRGARSSSV